MTWLVIASVNDLEVINCIPLMQEDNTCASWIFKIFYSIRIYSLQVCLLVLATAAAAQFPRNDIGSPNQYDNQGNLIQRTPSFLGNSQLGGNRFGVQTLDSNPNFQGQNPNSRLNQQLGASPFDRLNSPLGQQQIQFRSQNQLGGQFGQQHQAGGHIGQQNQLGNQFRQQQQATGQFRTAEAGASVISSRSENDGLGQYSFG